MDYSDVTFNAAGGDKQNNRKPERGGEKSSKTTSSSGSGVGRRIKRADSTTVKSVKSKHSELEYDYKSIEDYQYTEKTKKKRFTTHRPPGGGGDKTSFASLNVEKGNTSSSDGTAQKGASLPTDREVIQTQTLVFCTTLLKLKNMFSSGQGLLKLRACFVHRPTGPIVTAFRHFSH